MCSAAMCIFGRGAKVINGYAGRGVLCSIVFGTWVVY